MTSNEEGRKVKTKGNLRSGDPVYDNPSNGRDLIEEAFSSQ